MHRSHLNIALVGCGAVAERRHLPALVRRDDCKVVALVDHHQARAQDIAAKLAAPSVLTDYHDLFSIDVDAAIVALPNHLHAPVSIELLERGIHVLLEKPMALSRRECDAILQAASAGHAVLTVGLMRRFLHAGQFAKWAIEHGLLGRIISFDIRDGMVYRWPLASNFSFHKETAGGGVLLDTGAHTLDQLLWWLGAVESFEYYDNNYGGVESDCELHVTLASGAKGIVELSRTRNLRNTAIIRGDRAALEVGLVHNTVSLCFRNSTMGIGGQGFPREHPELMQQGQIDLITAEHTDWFASIRNGYPPTVAGVEVRESIALIEACYAERRALHMPWIMPHLVAGHVG
jgi:predicted dehydrogenase